jgi:hypothetical protein
MTALLAFFRTKLGIGLLIGLAVLAVAFTIYRKGVNAERARQDAAAAQAVAKAERRNAVAREKAEVRRQEDSQRITEQEKGYVDVIRNGQVGAPDAARVRLGCERLRRAGTPADRLPEPCRPGS